MERGVESLIIEPLERIADFDDKVYPSEALKNASAPFAFYRLLQDECEQDLSGDTELSFSRFELHIVAKTLVQVGQLADAARAELRRLAGCTVHGRYVERVRISLASPDLHDREVELFRRVYNVEIWWQEDDE